MTVLTSNTERNLSYYDKANLKDVLQVMPKWILTVNFTVEYLINVDSPVVKWKIHYTIVTPTANYHALIECSHSKMGALAAGSYVMLLQKYAEEK